MKEEKDKYFSRAMKEFLFFFICLVGGTAAKESGLNATSYLLFVAAVIMCVVALFTLIAFCGDGK